jgi:hypothetical protein
MLFILNIVTTDPVRVQHLHDKSKAALLSMYSYYISIISGG